MGFSSLCFPAALFVSSQSPACEGGNLRQMAAEFAMQRVQCLTVSNPFSRLSTRVARQASVGKVASYVLPQLTKPVKVHELYRCITFGYDAFLAAS